MSSSVQLERKQSGSPPAEAERGRVRSEAAFQTATADTTPTRSTSPRRSPSRKDFTRTLMAPIGQSTPLVSKPIETRFSPNSIGQTLSPSDMNKAVADYSKIHETDHVLGKIESDFSAYISELTDGYKTINNGSFGLRLNHGTSDLDLAIGVPIEDHERVLAKLHAVGKFVGIRKSTADSERHVFEFEKNGVTIDLGVLPPRDYALTKEGMEKCKAGMTENDRVTHTFMKKKLLAEGRMNEYKTFKLLPYATYFSSKFNFVPIG